MKKALAIVFLSSILGGCASYSVTSVGGHTTIDIENTGWYLLSFIPVASGDPDHPNEADFTGFANTVTLENNMKMLRRAMLENGAYKANNVVSQSTDEKVLLILLKRYALHTSAELEK